MQSGKIDFDELRKIVDDPNIQVTVRQLTERYGVSKQRIYQILDRWGVKPQKGHLIPGGYDPEDLTTKKTITIL